MNLRAPTPGTRDAAVSRDHYQRLKTRPLSSLTMRAFGSRTRTRESAPAHAAPVYRAHRVWAEASPDRLSIHQLISWLTGADCRVVCHTRAVSDGRRRRARATYVTAQLQATAPGPGAIYFRRVSYNARTGRARDSPPSHGLFMPNALFPPRAIVVSPVVFILMFNARANGRPFGIKWSVMTRQ